MNSVTFKRGFTIVEVLVVIAIIGVMTAVVTVSSSAARENAKVKNETAKVEQMELDMKLYREQHRVLPPGQNSVGQDSCSLCRYSEGNYSGAESAWNDVVAVFDSYTSVSASEDEWGNPYGYDNNYYVNDPSYYSIICSAGPDGEMQTFSDTANRAANYSLTVANPSPAGDDIWTFFR